MPPLVMPLVLAGALAAFAQGPAEKGTLVPQIVEIDGCVLPAGDCEEKSIDVLEVTVDGVPQRLGVLEIRVVTGTRIGGSLLGDLRGRTVRILGPEELLERLTRGSRLQLRAALRTGSQILYLQGVEDLEQNGSDVREQ